MDFSVPERIILAVLAYSAQFSYSLTKEELLHRVFNSKILTILEQKKSFPSKKISLKSFTLALESLLKRRLVLEEKGFYSLTSKKIKPRKANENIKKFKTEVIEELTAVAQKVPWVLAVILTGSFAAGVVEKKDDLDFLIITKKNRLWLTRFVFLLIAWLKGRRPHLPKGDLSHSWDFNFWLDETRLALPANKRGIYEAYEILLTRWVLDKRNTKQKFFQENKWVYDYFYFADFPVLKESKGTKQEKIDLLFWLEWLLFKLQDGYRQLRHGKQKTTLHSAFLHADSTKNNILNNWRSFYLQAIKPHKKVLVTGVFDILHEEHKNFLLAAKKEGDYLIVGLESDKRVKQIKGKNRPVFDQNKRQENLQKLKIADEVFILPEKFSTKEDHVQLINSLQPAILAVSSHSAHLAEKKKIMKKSGGVLKVVYQQNPAISTSKILAKK